MPRKGPAPKRPLVNDPVYGSQLVTQLVNKVLMAGKKSCLLYTSGFRDAVRHRDEPFGDYGRQTSSV